MEIDLLGLIAAGLLALTSLSLLLASDWRWMILALAGQYVGVFLLVWISWPLEQAVVKLIAGWMGGAILGTTLLSMEGDDWGARPSINRLFRTFAALLVILITTSVAPRLIDWVPGADLAQVWGGFLLFGMGLLHLGLTQQPLRVVLALLTLLSGFEVLYSAVEDSILVTGLLAVTTLSLCLVGAYLVMVPVLDEVD
ncbi:MAG TPA: hypothetical protein VJ768_01740 [Anaerolineales bacterium]|nr:hypothetical protein [Anaerolineales bacterium]